MQRIQLITKASALLQFNPDYKTSFGINGSPQYRVLLTCVIILVGLIKGGVFFVCFVFEKRFIFISSPSI